MSVQVTIVRNYLPIASARIEGISQRRLVLLRQRVANVAQSLARVDTGEMREGIQPTADGVVGSAGHTIYNEFGTRYMSAQPMLRPALAVAVASTSTAFTGFVNELF